MKKINYICLLSIAFAFGCEPEIDDVEFNYTTGGANFSNVVAVGNSLTAGYQSNALRKDKQENSFPAMLATQMQFVGGGSFTQPLLNDGVGIGGSGNAEYALMLSTDCLGEVGPSPEPIAAVGQIEAFTSHAGAGPFNNVGIPGAKSFHLLAQGYGSPSAIQAGAGNPFYGRFVNTSNPNETVLEAATSQNPTFFTLWIGNNDILSYATSGGAGVDQTGNFNPATYGSNDITDPNVFANAYNTLIDSLIANGAKGAVANIPDITTIPYFTTVPWNALVLTQGQADLLNGAFAAYNGGLDNPAVANQINDAAEIAQRKITFSAGPNGFVFLDSDLSSAQTGTGANDTLPKYRQLVAGELITLVVPSDDIKCKGFGSVNQSTQTANPMTGEYVLELDEVAAINRAADAYNATIKAAASEHGLAFVDAKEKQRLLATGGIYIDGTTYTDAFGTGGAFSLDGVHPSTRGYAIIANDFIDAINNRYGSTIPKVNVNSFPTIE
jgi:lysophospholipase L1-like esterase